MDEQKNVKKLFQNNEIENKNLMLSYYYNNNIHKEIENFKLQELPMWLYIDKIIIYLKSKYNEIYGIKLLKTNEKTDDLICNIVNKTLNFQIN